MNSRVPGGISFSRHPSLVSSSMEAIAEEKRESHESVRYVHSNQCYDLNAIWSNCTFEWKTVKLIGDVRHHVSCGAALSQVVYPLDEVCHNFIERVSIGCRVLWMQHALVQDFSQIMPLLAFPWNFREKKITFFPINYDSEFYNMSKLSSFLC